MKKMVMNIFAFGIMLSFLGGCALNNENKVLNFVFDGCTKVELTNGTTGNQVEIVDNGKIKTILNFFSIESFTRGESSSGSTGWRYRLKFYNNTDLIEDITVMEENRINYSGYFYESKNNNINIIYLGELFDWDNKE